MFKGLQCILGCMTRRRFTGLRFFCDICIQILAHFALALKTPKESILLFFAQKFELMLNSSLNFVPTSKPNLHPKSPIKSSRDNSIRDKTYHCAPKIASNLQKYNIIFMIRLIYAATLSGTQAEIAAFRPKSLPIHVLDQQCDFLPNTV